MRSRPRRRRLPAAYAVSACLLLLGAPAAGASHDVDDLIPAGSREADIRAIETALLGSQHAAEHAELRRLERGGAERRGGARMALSSERAVAPAVAGPPDEIGQWTEPPFQVPDYAIHTAVLPTGKVLFWGRPPATRGGLPRPNVGVAALWAPWLGTGPGAFTDVAPPVIDVDGPGGQPPGPAPIFCSGLSQLPTGEVLVAGGNLAYANTLPDDPYTDWGGLQTIFTFDPFSETWTQQPDMAEGRWYPTQTLLPDGRSIIAGGLSDEPPGGLMTDSIEVFNPPTTIGGQGSVEQEPTADRTGLGLYPRLFALGNGLVVTGPGKNLTATLNTTDFTWNETLPSMSRSRIAGNAVPQVGAPGEPDRIFTLGGFDRALNPGPFWPGSETSESIEPQKKPASWTPGAPLNVGRANSNTVLLPDGSMVVVGGGSGFLQNGGGGYVTYADGRARQVEVYDPDSNSWVLGPAQEEDRAYHSTAALLPDGRVFSAGDDHSPREADGGASFTDTAEIYSPPYLFKGPRPVIDSAPQALDWGDAFGIASDSPEVDRAVLVAPAATTHGVDMHQRYVELQVLNRIAGQGIDVAAPASATVAPPGYYMLFLLNDAGVPSVASWVKIDPTAPDQPMLGPPPKGDFNGDGFADHAIAAPLEDVGSAQDAGAVNIVYGSGAGLTDAGNQVIDQDGLGGGGAAEAGDRFGAALATGDFDRDGFADLAVGAPREDLGPGADAGMVNVLYGSAAGLSTPGSQGWSQDSTGIADAAEAGDRMGAALAAGDLDGDGDDDLVSGAPSETVGTVAAGAVNVIRGSASGLTDAGNQLFHQNSAGITEAAEAGDSFGAALAVGDLNDDSRGDLAVGVPSESVGSNTTAGAVSVIYGAASGLASAGSQLWHQNSVDVADKAEVGDHVGASLASGDLNGDGPDDLIWGAPDEAIGTNTAAGGASAIYGSPSGLASAGNQFWSQNSTDIKDAAEAGDHLGAAVAAGDLDHDGHDDLALGAPSESVGTAAAGVVNVIYGSASGLASARNQVWSQNSAGIVDTAEAGDSFGAALAIEDLNGDSHGELAIGAPSEAVQTVAAGSVNLLYGSAGGPTATNNQLWSQDSPNILEAGEAGDQFGAVLEAPAR